MTRITRKATLKKVKTVASQIHTESVYLDKPSRDILEVKSEELLDLLDDLKATD